jgi:hypothetical protein
LWWTGEALPQVQVTVFLVALTVFAFLWHVWLGVAAAIFTTRAVWWLWREVVPKRDEAETLRYGLDA